MCEYGFACLAMWQDLLTLFKTALQETGRSAPSPVLAGRGQPEHQPSSPVSKLRTIALNKSGGILSTRLLKGPQCFLSCFKLKALSGEDHGRCSQWCMSHAGPQGREIEPHSKTA